MSQLIPYEVIEKRILLIRNQKMMLDRHLAELYGVPTMRLNEAVKRNSKRFPPDFMFQLTADENKSLISHFAISKKRGGYRKMPYVFTEQGVAMLSSVLRSDRAVEVNIAVMRTFVRVREILSSHKDVLKKLEELEHKYESHDRHIMAIFTAIRQLISRLKPKKYKVGF